MLIGKCLKTLITPSHTKMSTDSRIKARLLGTSVVLPASFGATSLEACQPMRPYCAVLWRCRSRCVGVVSATLPGTALDRSGTITSASGWCLATVS